MVFVVSEWHVTVDFWYAVAILMAYSAYKQYVTHSVLLSYQQIIAGCAAP